MKTEDYFAAQAEFAQLSKAMFACIIRLMNAHGANRTASPPDIPDAQPEPSFPDDDAAFLADLDTALAKCQNEAQVEKVMADNNSVVEERGLEQAANELLEKHRARIVAAKAAKPDEATYTRIVAAMRAIEAQGGGNGALKVLAEVWKTSQTTITAMPASWQTALTAEKDRVKALLRGGGQHET